MISYHTAPIPSRENKNRMAYMFTRGFETADTNDPERMAKGVVKFACAPGVFLDGHRRKDNFLFADWIGLDFDSGELSLDQAVNTFCDMVHVIGVTMSHRTGDFPLDKFRVLIPLERRIDNLRLYEHQLAIAGKKWPVDEKCLEGARFFYPCREIVSVCTEGYAWEIDENMPPEPDFSAHARGRVKNGCIPMHTRRLLRNPWPPRTYNNTCFEIGCQLGIHGYTPEEITQMILESPTYQNRADAPKNEIFKAVKNGVERGFKDIQPKQNNV